jgi:hypothetical protein
LTFAIINLGFYMDLLLLKVSHHTLILNPLGVPFFYDPHYITNLCIAPSRSSDYKCFTNITHF